MSDTFVVGDRASPHVRCGKAESRTMGGSGKPTNSGVIFFPFLFRVQRMRGAAVQAATVTHCSAPAERGSSTVLM